MNETLIGHLEVILTILVPIGIAWYASRKESMKMHQENQNRLIAIETRLEPMWRWYTDHNTR